MIRRFAALSVISSAAVLGYVGARRLGEWLDAPISASPAPREATGTARGGADPSTHRMVTARDKTPA